MFIMKMISMIPHIASGFLEGGRSMHLMDTRDFG